MPIVYNNKVIEDVYYGSTRIRQVYLGSKLIWERLNSLYSCGRNDVGQLGLGDTNYRSTPTRAWSAEGWASVACGDHHNLAINTAGGLYSWGNNHTGQLGLGDYGAGTDRTSPTRVGTATNWATVSCGAEHNMAINTAGELYAWGHNNVGELGLGDSGSGAHRTIPTRVGTATNWASVACGNDHTIAINTAGELYACGWNNHGQLGLGSTPWTTTPTRVGTATNWVSVACGEFHTVAINTAGELYACGHNINGQLGLGDNDNRTSPTRVGTATNWASVACGEYHTVAINTAGELYVWGNNYYGRLGLGDTTNRTSPTRVGTATNWASVACGSAHTLAINTAGELYSWGWNIAGQLGLGDSGESTHRTTPTRVGAAEDWVSVDGGLSHSIGIRN